MFVHGYRAGAHEEHGGRRTVHPHASVAYYERGRADVWCGATYSLHPGDVLLIPEGMPHYTASAEDAHVLVLSMCTSCLTSVPGHHLAAMLHAVSEGASAVRTVAPGDRDAFRTLLVSLGKELGTNAAWQELAVDGYLSLLAAMLLRADSALDVTKGAELGATVSARALAFITRRATEGISLAEVARHVHRSAAHTAAVVKAETGRTVVEWITQARLAQARQLLLRTDESVEAIGSRMGFASPSHFHRVFKRHHGATPSDWRRAHAMAAAASELLEDPHHDT